MALDYATGGDIHLTGGQLLAATGLKKAEITDGTNLRDVVSAWGKVRAAHGDDARIELAVRDNGWSDVVRAIDRGRAVILQGDYNVLDPKFKCQVKPLKKGHAIVLLPERKNGAILVGDPLCRGFKFVPESQLQKFAERLGSKQHVFHAMTRAVPKPVVPRTAVPKVAPTKMESVDPRLDIPVAICDVTGPTDVFADPAGSTPLLKGWQGAPNVGLYARPKVGGVRTLAAIRIDLRGGPAEDLRIGWVADGAVSNVRLPPA
jgi:hypothetical protein